MSDVETPKERKAEMLNHGHAVASRTSAVLAAAEHWEKMRSGWATKPAKEVEERIVTTRSQLREAEDALVAAVRAWKALR